MHPVIRGSDKVNLGSRMGTGAVKGEHGSVWHPITLTAETLERCSPWDALTRRDWLPWSESKEHKQDPRMGELCYLEDPDLLNFAENHVLQCILPELHYHRGAAKENIQHAAEAYKQHYDA